MSIPSTTEDFIRERFASPIDVAVVLGSGLGAFVDKLPAVISVPTSEIPGYPQSTVAGHGGTLTLSEVHGKRTLFFSGRTHVYEGYTTQQTALPAAIACLLNANTLIVTNAAGGMNPLFRVGELMLITDYLVLPLARKMGLGLQTFECFGNNVRLLDDDMLAIVRTAAQKAGILLHEGVYGYCAGPTYETRSEIAFFRIAGVDAGGMSSVPEMIVAKNAGLQCIGISCITNKAMTVRQSVSHEEVTAVASRVASQFERLLLEIISNL